MPTMPGSKRTATATESDGGAEVVMKGGHVLIIHAVRDYVGWQQVFDAAATLRQQAGERAYSVLRDVHDAKRIVHFSQWESLAQARTFFESPRLVALRQQAGVEAPEFIYLQQLEAGVLEPSG